MRDSGAGHLGLCEGGSPPISQILRTPKVSDNRAYTGIAGYMGIYCHICIRLCRSLDERRDSIKLFVIWHGMYMVWSYQLRMAVAGTSITTYNGEQPRGNCVFYLNFYLKFSHEYL